MSRDSSNNSSLRCSFCSKSQSEVRKLIAGPNVYICDECIEICTDIISEERDIEERSELVDLPKPNATNTGRGKGLAIGVEI